MTWESRNERENHKTTCVFEKAIGRKTGLFFRLKKRSGRKRRERNERNAGILRENKEKRFERNKNKELCLLRYRYNVLAFGCRFSDRITGDLDSYLEHGKLIHIDIDPAEISKNVRATIPLVADAHIDTKWSK